MDFKSYNGYSEKQRLLKKFTSLNSELDFNISSKLAQIKRNFTFNKEFKKRKSNSCTILDDNLIEEKLLSNYDIVLQEELFLKNQNDVEKQQLSKYYDSINITDAKLIKSCNSVLEERLFSNQIKKEPNLNLDVKCVLTDNVSTKESICISCHKSCNAELEKQPLLKTIDHQLQLPSDTFYLAYLLAFFTGVIGLLPLTFFLVANDYWMYKFRDLSIPSDSYNLNHKTYLQTMFISMNSMCTAFPSVISVFLTAKLGQRIAIRTRFLIAMGFQSCMFIVFTGLIEVNTDAWQTTFFLASLLVIGSISFFQPFCSMTNVLFLSNFPSKYMNVHMYGTATGGLFGSTLQIISLSIGNNSTQIAFIYFATGTVVILFTFFLMYMMKYSPLIQYYLHSSQDDESKAAPTLKDYREAFKRTWFLMLMIIINTVGAGLGHPNITSLVVSEGYTGTGENLWYDKYFVVTATYFLFDLFQLFGRFFGKGNITKHNYHWYIVLAIVKSFGIGVLFLFCNAQPRQHLPVWFPYDYQYILILAVYSFISSVILGEVLLSLPSVAKDKTPLAYMMLMGLLTLIITTVSPLNPLYLQLL